MPFSGKFVVIGNVCIDVFPDGMRGGGAALYSGVAANRLGWGSIAVTGFADDYLNLNPELAGMEIVRQSRNSTTSFAISYDGSGSRRISLIRKGERLVFEGLEAIIPDASVLMFAPVAGEYDADFVKKSVRRNSRALALAAPQGWMRSLREGDEAAPMKWESASSILPLLNVLVVSDEDIGVDYGLVKEYASMIGREREMPGVVVCTHGKLGATAYYGRKKAFAPALAANPVDTTGAGDVFAAAFGIRYCESGNLMGSLKFAHAAAAFAIEGHGTSGIAPRSKVESRALAKNLGSFL